MKTLVRLLLILCMWVASTLNSSAQNALISGVYHETGYYFDGAWHDVGTPGSAITIVVYENEMYYGNDYAVRRGNTNIYGFVGRRYNLINQNGQEQTAWYYVVSDDNQIVRVWEVEYNYGTIPGIGMNLTQKTVSAYTTAPGYPVPRNNSNSYNNSSNYNSYSPQQSTAQRQRVCPKCHGTGSCPVCQGLGYTSNYGYKVLCTGCEKDHNGVCPTCHGKGTIPE